MLTALISVNGAVAALLPVVVVMAIRLGRPPSQLLMPLVFAAHAGSLLALTGTPVNVLVSEAAPKPGCRRSAFSSSPSPAFRWCSARSRSSCCSASVSAGAQRPHASPPDLSKHAHTLVEQYRLDERLFQLRVRDAHRMSVWRRARST